MNDGGKIIVGQYVRIKCQDSPMCVFNGQMGTVVGFTEDGQINVRPDSAPLDQLLHLFRREVRDTIPYREAPAEIKASIPEFQT